MVSNILHAPSKNKRKKHTKTHTHTKGLRVYQTLQQTSRSGEFSETKKIKQRGIIPSPTNHFLRFESLLELDPKIIETKQIIRGEAKIVRFSSLNQGPR